MKPRKKEKKSNKGSEPENFHFLKKITRALTRHDTDETADDPDFLAHKKKKQKKKGDSSSISSDTHKKKKKKEKKRKRSDSSSSSTPSCIVALREGSKKKKKKKKGDDKVLNASKFVLPSAPSASSGSEPVQIDLILQAKELLIKGCFLADKVTMDDLKEENWIDSIVAAARQEDLKALAGQNGISQAGSKKDIAARVLKYVLE